MNKGWGGHGIDRMDTDWTRGRKEGCAFKLIKERQHSITVCDGD